MGGHTGWIGTHRTSYKQKHLLANHNVSLAYITDAMNPVYADCTAEWVDDVGGKGAHLEPFPARAATPGV